MTFCVSFIVTLFAGRTFFGTQEATTPMIMVLEICKRDVLDNFIQGGQVVNGVDERYLGPQL